MPFTQLNTDFGGGYRLKAAMEIAERIRKARERYDEDQQKKEFNQGVFDQLKDQTDAQGNSLVPPNVLESWNSSNPDKQAGLLAGILSKQKEDRLQRTQNRQDDLAAAQSNLLWAKGDAAWRGTDGSDGSSSEPIQTDPVIHPQTKQPVPGLGYDRKTGALINFNALQSTGVNVQIDPKTGVAFYLDAKGNPKALTADQLYGGKQLKAEQTAKQDAANSPSFADTIKGWLGAINPAAAPLLTAHQLDGLTGQTPLPGTTPPASAAPAGPRPQLSAQDQQALTWAYANPQDPRAAAILKKLGIQ